MSNYSANFLNQLTQIKDVRTARASSWDQAGGNQDYWMIPAGESIVLGDIEGPGSITHIWMTSFCRRVLGPSVIDSHLGAHIAPVNEIHNALGVTWEIPDPAWYRKVLIKMTWDDQAHPSVLVPLGDFFCIGHSMPASFSSLPFSVSVKPEEQFKFGGVASVNCYLPMPFNKRARIEIVNENDVPFGLYFHIDYELYRKPHGEETAYFHAQWRRENSCEGWGSGLQVNTPEVNSVMNLDGADNYVFLEAEGKGHYIGCNLSVTHFQGSWWGEGDDMFFIDGEEMPSIVGTGSEDYFNHAWGMQKVAFPFAGSIVHESDVPGYQVSYRFHITDPVYFSKSLKVTMEHGHANHLSDDWASTAYWYQTLPSKPFSILPVEERIQLMPKVISPIAQPAPQALNNEMKKSFQEAEDRMKKYSEGRQAELQKKLDRTPGHSQGNIDLSKQVRSAFLSGENK
ncbi:DUF2961 domain-containing protein [Cohnella sp.]|uniref:DUF2961 domain-containing protein n=1 Tax=Cohnella sp. TaxID=1883426 RepID=UPI0035666EA4